MYDMLGINLETDEQEGFYNYYCTPYLFWANDSAKECLQKKIEGEGGILSACFLMNELFKVLGYEGNQFMQASNQLYEVLNGKGQILRSTSNTAPLTCGACNTQPEGLLTMA